MHGRKISCINKTRYEHTIARRFNHSSDRNMQSLQYHRKTFISLTGVMSDLYFSTNKRFKVHV